MRLNSGFMFTTNAMIYKRKAAHLLLFKVCLPYMHPHGVGTKITVQDVAHEME